MHVWQMGRWGAGVSCRLWCGVECGVLTILSILEPIIRGRNWYVGVHKGRTARSRRMRRAQRRCGMHVWHVGRWDADVGGWLWYVTDSDFLAILMAISWS